MSKDIFFGEDNRKKLLNGALTFSKVVTKTMGPKSGTVMMQRMAGLLSTKDGVTVAREIHLKNSVENMGCAILREACIKVNDEAGDGTTTTACLAAAIVKEGHKLIMAGVDPMMLVKGIKNGAEFVRDVLIENSADVSTKDVLTRVAMISSNNDREVAETLSEACLAVGKNGTVVIEDGNGLNIELEFKDGMEIERGAASSYFLSENETDRIVEGPLVAIIPAVLSKAHQVQSMMEVSSQWPDNDLLVVCYGLEGEALQMMVMNHTKGIVKSCVVKSHGFGHRRKDYLGDIAALAGCEVLEADMGFNLEDFDADWFGSFRQATIGSKKTVFMAYDEASSSIKNRITELKRELESCAQEYSIDKLQERIAKLQGGFCIVRVGGTTESVIRERRARIEDTLGAVQSALRNGVVSGGGSAYLNASQKLEIALVEEEGAIRQGMQVLAKALQSPIRQLALNSQQDGGVVVVKIKEHRASEEYSDWVGWDALTNEIRDLASNPMVIDPLDVALSALEASVSVATLLLTVEASIV